MQQDRTARSALTPHPGDNVAQVTTSAQPSVPDTAPLSDVAAAALARLERAFAPKAAGLPGDWYTTAAQAVHNTHCTSCRERTAASDRAAAENAASMARRDRRQLGLRIVTSRTEVA